MQEAEKRPLGIHLVLGSFAIKIEGEGIMNVTPFIRCGKPADVDYIIKNYSSTVDVSYQDTDGVTMTRLDSRDVSSIQMPQLSIQGKTHTFSCMNIIPCTTSSGETLLTAIDICLDHQRGVAMSNLEEMVEADMSILGNQVSHLVISNTVSLKPSKSIGKVMHVDPEHTQTACKSIELAIPFGKNKINLYTHDPTPCQTLGDSLKEQAPEEVEENFNNKYNTLLRFRAILEGKNETLAYLNKKFNHKIALFEEAKTQIAALEALNLSSNDVVMEDYIQDFKYDFTYSDEETEMKKTLEDIKDTVTALTDSSIQTQLAEYRKHDWAIPNDLKKTLAASEADYLTCSIITRKSDDYKRRFSIFLSATLHYMEDHAKTLFKQKINTLEAFKKGPNNSTIDELIDSKTEEFNALRFKGFDKKQSYFQTFDSMLKQLEFKTTLNQEISEQTLHTKQSKP